MHRFQNVCTLHPKCSCYFEHCFFCMEKYHTLPLGGLYPIHIVKQASGYGQCQESGVFIINLYTTSFKSQRNVDYFYKTKRRRQNSQTTESHSVLLVEYRVPTQIVFLNSLSFSAFPLSDHKFSLCQFQ